jgi:hypothetical protein
MVIYFIKIYTSVRSLLTKENLKKLWEWGKELLSKKEETESSLPSNSTKFRWRSFLEETPGVGSSMRLAFLLVIICVMYFWSWSAYDSVKTHKPLPDIPTNVVMLTLGVGGSKMAQACWGEKDK